MTQTTTSATATADIIFSCHSQRVFAAGIRVRMRSRRRAALFWAISKAETLGMDYWV